MYFCGIIVGNKKSSVGLFVVTKPHRQGHTKRITARITVLNHHTTNFCLYQISLFTGAWLGIKRMANKGVFVKNDLVQKKPMMCTTNAGGVFRVYDLTRRSLVPGENYYLVGEAPDCHQVRVLWGEYVAAVNNGGS